MSELRARVSVIFPILLFLVPCRWPSSSEYTIARDGETTRFEGVLLLVVYAVLGIAFYFVKA